MPDALPAILGLALVVAAVWGLIRWGFRDDRYDDEPSDGDLGGYEYYQEWYEYEKRRE